VLTITPQTETILRSKVVDQAALHGLLNVLRDLNVTLLLVQRLEGEIEQRGVVPDLVGMWYPSGYDA
jgi:hypothetical protein